MDCVQAEVAMMQHVEKTITAEMAKKLAEHILTCETCHEYFFAFDEMMEAVGDDFEVVEAPDGFVDSVMARVSPSTMVFSLGRVLSGISAVIVGALVFINYPAIESFAEGFVNNLHQLGQSLQVFGQIEPVGDMGVIALFFVLMLGGLLTILYNQEASVNT